MGTRTGEPNTTTLVEKRHPGSVYTVLHQLKPISSVEAVLHFADPQAPALYDLSGTPLGEKPDINGVPPIRYTDALLYVGPPGSLTESKPPDGSLDATYMKEVDRRSMIEWGELRARKFLGSAVAK